MKNTSAVKSFVGKRKTIDNDDIENQNFIDDDVKFQKTEAGVKSAKKATKTIAQTKSATKPTKKGVEIKQTDNANLNTDNVSEPVKGTALKTKSKIIDWRGKTNQVKDKDKKVDVDSTENDDKQAKKGRSARKGKIEQPLPVDHSNETSKYAMEIRTGHGLTIKKMIDNISSLLKTVDIRFYPEGIYICAADLAKYALISISLYAENFSKYYCPQRFKITLDIGALNNALSSVNSFETLSFVFQKKDSRNLALLLKTEGRRERTIILYGMNSENKVFRVPKQKFENPMVFKASEFQQDIRSMCYYSPMITFATNYKEFHMLASGEQGTSHLRLFPEHKDININHVPKTDNVETTTMDVDIQPGTGYEGVEEVFDENVNGPVPIQSEELNDEETVILKNLEKGDEIAEKIQGDVDKYMVNEDEVASELSEPPSSLPGSDAQPTDTTEQLEDLGNPTFDETFCSGLFILRYFHTICKNTNLAEYVEIMVKAGEFVTTRYPVETLGHLTFCVLECHPNSQ